MSSSIDIHGGRTSVRMGSLTFVGLGLGSSGVSLEGADAIRKAEVAFLEYYTAPHEASLLSRLQGATGKSVVVVDRAFVEDGREIISRSKAVDVVLAVPGDPMIATTHGDLRARAIREGVRVKVIFAATIVAAAASASGLHWYKFARSATITREGLKALTGEYNLLHANLMRGSHTLFLLEYDTPSGEEVAPGDAIGGLMRAEVNLKRGVVGKDTFGLVLSRVGREDSSLKGGTFDALLAHDYGSPPHVIVVPGELHFSEGESVAAVFGLEPSEVRSNSGLKRTAETLVPKYVAKARRALDSVRGELGDKYGQVVENVELYLKDSENFLANGEDELAMLSVGYAEGLLDSLSFSGVVKIDWG